MTRLRFTDMDGNYFDRCRVGATELLDVFHVNTHEHGWVYVMRVGETNAVFDVPCIDLETNEPINIPEEYKAYLKDAEIVLY